MMNLVSGVVGLVRPLKDLYEQAKEEIKYFEVFPGEYKKEVELAEERKKNGDKFNPSYEEYLDILKKAKDEDSIVIIKWERHFSKSLWTAHIKK